MLTKDETRLLHELHLEWMKQRREDEENERYFDAQQRVRQLGISIPPEMEAFAFPMSWCRTWVETIESRMEPRLLLRSGSTTEDKDLRIDWDANNLDSESQLAHRDLLVLGRAVVSVGWPDREHGQTRPVIRVESPRDFAVKVDPLTRRMVAALRVYTNEDTGLMEHLTLYLPDETIYISRQKGKWADDERRRHNLGRVPIVVAYTRRRSGRWKGTTMMADVKHWTDMASRIVLNLQVAMEALSTPQKIAYGLTRQDFVDPDTGEPLDEWDTYLGAIWAISASKKDGASIEQLPAGSLDGFINAMELCTKQVSGATGLPLRMLGHSTVNPASEGGIKADETRMTRTAERMDTVAGSMWGWVLGIAERMRLGNWPEGSPIKLEWRNPGTPTLSEMADSVSKRTGGVPVLSARGAMHEMGYSQARIDQEMRWLDEESRGVFSTDDKLERPPFGDSSAYAGGGG
ncbi:phage portal protein [Corynebacterium hansenii]|uniref:Phage portal protein n=1 Tax=Corynebacterium hansenii TaxID=394964 RepID=A0ABV7ZND4_9CORY|nr:phage portal protein [Corynebacterium hansenii]WJZ00668.1 Phage portal protein, SPP1 Gp6-like [Corynebacterium hansenii]